MFTGIISALGSITSVKPCADGVQIDVSSATLGLDDVALGDSIALNGACMTVAAKTDTHFTVYVSAESLRCTVGLDQQNGQLNLEKALRFGDRVGGHLVSGHIDAVGYVRVFAAAGESYQLIISAPQVLARYLAVKGSVTVNGVSLTINSLTDTSTGCECAMNIIPHTLAVTTLKLLKVGDGVNVEVDLVARYLERLLQVK